MLRHENNGRDSETLGMVGYSLGVIARGGCDHPFTPGLIRKAKQTVEGASVLKEPVNCRFSNLRKTSAPLMELSILEKRQGVCSTPLAMTSAAERISLRVICITLFNRNSSCPKSPIYRNAVPAQNFLRIRSSSSSADAGIT